MIRDLGIDVDRYSEVIDEELFLSRGMRRGVFFDRETFGEDRLAVRDRDASWADFLVQTPLSEAARRDIVRLYEDKVDYLAGLALAGKRDFLRSVSYEKFLLETARSTATPFPPRS